MLMVFSCVCSEGLFSVLILVLVSICGFLVRFIMCVMVCVVVG